MKNPISKVYQFLWSIMLITSLLPITNSVANDMFKAADIKNGKKLTIPCIACHTINKGEPSKGSSKNRIFVGPNLFGIFGRKIANKKDFAYSHSLMKFKNQKWTIKELSKFLKSPSSYAPGTKMTFNGLLDPQDRMDVIAYLATLK